MSEEERKSEGKSEKGEVRRAGIGV